MGETAENLAEKYEISRTIQDEYALRSQERAKVAVESGYFKDQISPIEVRKGRDTFTFETDEHPRATSIDKLANLRPVFRENGSVTAGNSSGINDGAAAVVLTTATQAQTLGLTPRMRMVARAESGVDPSIMGQGPIPALSLIHI